MVKIQSSNILFFEGKAKSLLILVHDGQTESQTHVFCPPVFCLISIIYFSPSRQGSEWVFLNMTVNS